MPAEKMQNLAPAELRDRQNSGELWRVLDVREPWEIEIAAIAGATAIPLQELPHRYGELDATAPLAVLCHTGSRSARAADWLLQQGFRQVANIEGGIDAWSRQIDTSIPRY